jgi:hypothetical protein
MSVQSAEYNAQTLLDQLLCPVLLEPLSEAVSLVPCAHKVQQAVAEQLFGATGGGWLVQSEKPCPVCRTSVLGYMADHSTRNIVEQLFELSESEINEMLATIKKSLPEKSMSVEKDLLIDMPYPGKPARFVHHGGDWNLFNISTPGAKLCRQLEFKSSTEDSLITDFIINGYKDGDVTIQIVFKEYREDARQYFKQFEIFIGLFALSFNSETKTQLKALFNIIANNNEIPASHFELIRDLVAKGTHK